MKKVLFVLAAIVSFAFAAQAQSEFNKGQLVGNLGIGLGTYTSGNYSFPPLSVSADYGIVDGLLEGKASIGLGGYLGYYGYKTVIWNDFGHRFSNVTLAARGTFHYTFVPKLDTYAGLMLGYNIATHSYYGNGTLSGELNSGTNVANSGVFPALFLGARYFFTPKFGAFAEVGYGISALELGITCRF